MGLNVNMNSGPWKATISAGLEREAIKTNAINDTTFMNNVGGKLLVIRSAEFK